MELFLEHLMKSSVILLLFLGSYHLFLRKETFFGSNRFFLIMGLLTSLLLPFINITKIIYVPRPAISTIDTANMENIVMANASSVSLSWINLIVTIYLIGVIYFAIRLMIQLRTIHVLKKNSDVVLEDEFSHVKTSSAISPFSFFKHIFYYPNQFSHRELRTIISHEKMHARGMHSLDILFTEITLILMWFNPAIWFYKNLIKQNLEFLADAGTCEDGEDKRAYQYLMLKQATEHHKINIVNPFFNSIIKKRIVMLNQNQSKRINLLKFLIVLPFLGLFLLGFNTKEIVKFSENESSISAHLEAPEFTNPIKTEDLIRVSADFGPMRSPFTKKIENHTGIDLVTKSGKPVLASAKGIVKTSNKDESKGNYIVIEHTGGYSTKYMHLKDRTVAKGETVQTGDAIGHVGSTGKSTGPHLHFEILKSEKAINPASFIPLSNTRKSLAPKIETEKSDASAAVIELVINKNTTDGQLLQMKADLAEENIDFSYTTVRNDAREIIAIELELVNGTISTATYNSDGQERTDEDVIEPVFIFVDTDKSTISVGRGKQTDLKTSNSTSMVWISDDDASESKEIIVKKVKGKKIVTLNGKELKEDEFEDMDIQMDDSSLVFISDDDETSDKKSVKIYRSKTKDGDKSVYIHTDTENVEDVKVVVKKKSIFLSGNKKDEPLYVIDGENADRKAMKKLGTDKIASINVIKGAAAKEKYGKKAKNGVIEITTKKE